jgi:hypothetical protein
MLMFRKVFGFLAAAAMIALSPAGRDVLERQLSVRDANAAHARFIGRHLAGGSVCNYR